MNFKLGRGLKKMFEDSMFLNDKNTYNTNREEDHSSHNDLTKNDLYTKNSTSKAKYQHLFKPPSVVKEEFVSDYCVEYSSLQNNGEAVVIKSNKSTIKSAKNSLENYKNTEENHNKYDDFDKQKQIKSILAFDESEICQVKNFIDEQDFEQDFGSVSIDNEQDFGSVSADLEFIASMISEKLKAKSKITTTENGYVLTCKIEDLAALDRLLEAL